MLANKEVVMDLWMVGFVDIWILDPRIYTDKPYMVNYKNNGFYRIASGYLIFLYLCSVKI